MAVDPQPDPSPDVEPPSGIPDDAPASLGGKPNGVDHDPPAGPEEGVTPLGHNNGLFFYLSRKGGQIVELSAEGHTKRALLGLASLPHHWQRTRFHGPRGVNWDDAADDLMTTCRRIGIFNASRVRGRGAWYDQKRAVLHLGDRLIVDGIPAELALPSSGYIYPKAYPLRIDTEVAPLDIPEASKLLAITNALQWEKHIHGRLFAGWCVCALVCGALPWRPAIWLTGGSGSGKSWVMENILVRIVGPIALRVQSKTTEAGIRQTLRTDALPVLFEEFEREDREAGFRVQGVLDLVRQSSSEGVGFIVKGSASQRAALIYRIRSCFAFASINVALAHGADESRVTILGLTMHEATEGARIAFQALQAQAQATLTPEYASALLMRCVAMLGTIIANAHTFSDAVALELGTKRQGDQLGALLAGAFALEDDRTIDLKFARAYVMGQDWGEASSETVPSHQRLLNRLMAQPIRTNLGHGPLKDVPVGRMLNHAVGDRLRVPNEYGEYPTPTGAENDLLDLGMRPDFNGPVLRGIYVSVSHPALAKVLDGTEWAAKWALALARLPDSRGGREQPAIRFGPGHQTRAVWLPAAILDLTEPSEPASVPEPMDEPAWDC
jgi:putative DNA primase/helicase